MIESKVACFCCAQCIQRCLFIRLFTWHGDVVSRRRTSARIAGNSAQINARRQQRVDNCACAQPRLRHGTQTRYFHLYVKFSAVVACAQFTVTPVHMYWFIVRVFINVLLDLKWILLFHNVAKTTGFTKDIDIAVTDVMRMVRHLQVLVDVNDLSFLVPYLNSLTILLCMCRYVCNCFRFYVACVVLILE